VARRVMRLLGAMPQHALQPRKRRRRGCFFKMSRRSRWVYGSLNGGLLLYAEE